MKKILFITVLQVLLIGGSVKAEVVQIPIHTASLTDNRERGPIRHSPTKVKVPIVTLDDNTITVQTNHYGQELYLTLEDGYGNTIYTTNSVSSSKLSFDIPIEILQEAVSITITINGVTYVGEM